MKEFIITHQLRILSIVLLVATIVAGIIGKDIGGALISAFFVYASFKYEK